MAQDISGTGLAAAAAAAVREPVCLVYFDWGDDGFAAGPGGWTDESAYLVSASGESRQTGYGKSLAGIGTGVADSATVVLRNPEAAAPDSGFRFSPSNADGPLYGQIGGGAIRMTRAQVRVGFGAETVPVLTGYVVDLGERYGQRQVEIEIRDRAAAMVRGRYATGIQENVLASEYLATLAALVDRDPPGLAYRSFDSGLCLMPFAWLEDEDLWREMGMVAEAQGGRIWWDHAGVLRFEDGSHFVRPRADAWRSPLTSQYTFTVADFAECNPRYNPADVVNHVIVEYWPRTISVLQVVYSAVETYIVPAGGSLTVRATHQYPASAIVTPVAGVDYLAGTAGGTDLTAEVTVAASTSAKWTDLEIANGNGDYAAYIYALQVRGYPLLSSQPISVEVEDAASIAAHGRCTQRFANPYVASYRHALSLAQMVLARFKAPPLTISLDGVPGVPYLEPGDRVTVTEARTGVDDDFFIGEIGWRWDHGFTQRLELVRAADMYPYGDYFLVGTSEYGNAPDPQAGRLFW